MKNKTINIRLQQCASGSYRIEQMTNATVVSGPFIEAVCVGDYLTKQQAQALCDDRGVNVTVNAIKS